MWVLYKEHDGRWGGQVNIHVLKSNRSCIFIEYLLTEAPRTRMHAHTRTHAHTHTHTHTHACTHTQANNNKIIIIIIFFKWKGCDEMSCPFCNWYFFSLFLKRGGVVSFCLMLWGFYLGGFCYTGMNGTAGLIYMLILCVCFFFFFFFFLGGGGG